MSAGEKAFEWFFENGLALETVEISLSPEHRTQACELRFDQAVSDAILQ